MIRNAKQQLFYRRELSSLSALRNRVDKMISSFNLHDEETLPTIDKNIGEITKKLDEYNSTVNMPDADCLRELRATQRLPELLIQARVSLGWKQSGLAKVLDLNPQQIYRYESKSYSNISLSVAMRIAAVLIQGLENELALRRRVCKVDFDPEDLWQ